MRIHFKLFILAFMLVTIGFGIGTGGAALLVDRGLPTANLNADDPSARSNTSLGDLSPWIVGDTFSPRATGTLLYNLDMIRVWVVGDPAATSLFGGSTATGMISPISTTILSDSVVTYADGSLYAGGAYDIHQVDFKVDLTIAGHGEGYYFFVGTGPTQGFSPFLHASNAGLSGSPQDGADGIYWEYNTLDGTLLGLNSGLSTLGQPSADINVQVFGKEVPEPASILLIGFGLAGLAASRKKFKKA